VFRQLGFSAVGLDLEGLVSGKLNRELAGND
jgi:PP-loop superfamily ATP-utilizing enzyme